MYNFDWQPKSIHIRCLCNNTALIVNAGLAELGIVAPPPTKIKESILGMFPYPNNMETILEEDELEDGQDSPGSGPVRETDSNPDNDSEPKYDEEEYAALLQSQENNVYNSESEKVEYQATNRNESNTLDCLTKKVRRTLSFFACQKKKTKNED